MQKRSSWLLHQLHQHTQSTYTFTQYHRVISVDKFVDDYARNVGNANNPKVFNKIESNHRAVKSLIHKLRRDMNSELDSF